MGGVNSGKRAIAFFDGQNLYFAAKDAFGLEYSYPNYEPRRLAEPVCKRYEWTLIGIRFYTGVPALDKDPFWHEFWNNKLRNMQSSGIEVFRRELRYSEETTMLSGIEVQRKPIPKEKGIDVRIALDLMMYFLEDRYDAGVIFSQDQDLSEAVADIQKLAEQKGKDIILASAFPVGKGTKNSHGINGTIPIRTTKIEYAQCTDRRDYRPKIRRGTTPADL
ncbi:MAG: NYN domain-containing protein [Planctomycetota bacterium]